MLNIAGMQDIVDPEYRYKMPKIVAKIEGRGNGIKTVIVNCVELSLSLHRSPGEVTKYFGTELGAQSKFDAASEKSIVNGARDASDLQTHLKKYIELFVLCPNCRLPETKYRFKSGCIYHSCASCGERSAIDMSQKLCTFILKEHEKDRKEKKKDKKDKGEKKKEKGEKKKKDRDQDNEDDASPKTSKKKKDGKEKKSKKKQEDDEDNITWYTDTSAEAVAERAAEAEKLEARAQAAASGAGSASASGDEEEDVVATLENLEIDDMSAVASAVDSLKEFISNNGASDAAILDEARRIQTNSALHSSDRVKIVVESVFSDNLLKELTAHDELLKKLVCSEQDRIVLISSLLRFCAVTHPKIKKLYQKVLFVLYENDVITEDSVRKWYNQDYTKAVTGDVPAELVSEMKDSIKPFIVWLDNAEEESDDEE